MTITNFTSASVITPSNTTVLRATAALWVGGAGNVAVMMKGGTAAITLTAVPAGTLLPLSVTQVMATGTTATAVVALY